MAETHHSVHSQPVTPEQAAQGQKPTKEFFVADDTKPLWFYCKQVGHCGKGRSFCEGF